MKTLHVISGPLLTLLFAAGCSTIQADGTSAVARMQPTQGHNARGTVTFIQHGDRTKVTASFSGLTPGGHGFHIHEKGDCSAADGTSTGGHFNPVGKKHGHPSHTEHHVGDLPMLEADANGNASLTAVLPGLTLREGGNSIVGRGVIVHAASDDFKTQPTGNAGARVSCGVIAAQQS